MVEFAFRSYTFVVKVGLLGKPIYRDKLHIEGDCWADAETSIKNTDLHPQFRKRLKEAVERAVAVHEGRVTDSTFVKRSSEWPTTPRFAKG